MTKASVSLMVCNFPICISRALKRWHWFEDDRFMGSSMAQWPSWLRKTIATAEKEDQVLPPPEPNDTRNAIAISLTSPNSTRIPVPSPDEGSSASQLEDDIAIRREQSLVKDMA